MHVLPALGDDALVSRSCIPQLDMVPCAKASLDARQMLCMLFQAYPSHCLRHTRLRMRCVACTKYLKDRRLSDADATGASMCRSCWAHTMHDPAPGHSSQNANLCMFGAAQLLLRPAHLH